MKKALVLIFILGISFNSYSQGFQSHINLEAAIEAASSQDQDILMVFSGSDWCRPCKQFKKLILDDVKFQNYCDESLTILYLDFPSKKKNKLSEEQKIHNEELAAKYNASGTFPKLILFSNNLEKLKEIPYQGEAVNAFIKKLEL